MRGRTACAPLCSWTALLLFVCCVPDVAFTVPALIDNNCNNPHNIFLTPAPGGNTTHVEGIDTCSAGDTHSGSDVLLEGPDYTFFIKPNNETDSIRVITVEAKPSDGSGFDTVLWAYEQCVEYHTKDDLVATNDDEGSSRIKFSLEPNQGMYIVLSGAFGNPTECGLADVVFTAEFPPDNNCNNPHNIFLPPAAGGNTTRVEGIDLCSEADTHTGSVSGLEGPDYTFYIVPTNATRVMEVKPSGSGFTLGASSLVIEQLEGSLVLIAMADARAFSAGFIFEAKCQTTSVFNSLQADLKAFEQCNEYHTLDDLVATNDLGDGDFTRMRFSLKPNQGMYIVLTALGPPGNRDECGVADVVFTAEFPPDNNCFNPHNIFLPPAPGGDTTRVEGIDTCSAADTHSGSNVALDGPDYTFYIMPTNETDSIRVITVEVKPSDGSGFNTALWAYEQCNEYHTIYDGAETGDSRMRFSLEPNQGIYIVLGGDDNSCGVADVVFTAEIPPDNICNNTHNIFLPASADGNTKRVRAIDLCSAADTFSGGSRKALNGPDYTFYIEPTNEARIMEVETTESSGSVGFDTILWALERCDQYPYFSDVTVARDDFDGDSPEGFLGSFSKIRFTVQPNQGMYVVLGGDRGCGVADVVFTALIPLDNNCDNPHNIFLPASADGNTMRVEGIDLCLSVDTHSGEGSDLEGRDYTLFIQPTNEARIIEVETKSGDEGLGFDTRLWAYEQCDEYHEFDDEVARDDAGGVGSDSKMRFTLAPNQGMYVVLGSDFKCGVADVVFTAHAPENDAQGTPPYPPPYPPSRSPPSPLPPSPPSPPPPLNISPPPALVCDIVRSEGSSSADNILKVKVNVKDTENIPVPGELVKLEDVNGPGDAYGGTSADGCLLIYEGTGPSCEDLKLLLPFRPGVKPVDLGCKNSGDLEYTFIVPGPTPPPPPPVPRCDHVFSNGSSTRENTFAVTVRVKDTHDFPMPGELVKLEDVNGPGDTYGGTSADGCLVIYEGTGPSCKDLKLLLPTRPGVKPVDLGCKNSGDLEYTFIVPGNAKR